MCTEPFGTISYVAPEVLLEQPYNNSVDLWSLGIIAFLLLSGSLPFDHEYSEVEVAKLTIHSKAKYNKKKWNDISPEAKAFVEGKILFS